MRTNLANALLDDDSPSTTRVMRAYWLAARSGSVSRPATIIALPSSNTTPSHDLSSRRTFSP